MTLHRSNFNANPEQWALMKHHALRMPHLKVTDDCIHAWTTYRAATTPVDSADERFEKAFQWPPANWTGSMVELYRTQQNTNYDADTFAVLFGRLAKRNPHRVRKVHLSRKNYWIMLDTVENEQTKGESQKGVQ